MSNISIYFRQGKLKFLVNESYFINLLFSVKYVVCKLPQAFSLCINVFQFVSMYFTLYQCISLLSVYFTLYQCISLCINVFHFVSMYFTLYQCISLCINVFHFVSMYFNLYQCISLCSNVYFTLYQCIWLCFNIFYFSAFFELLRERFKNVIDSLIWFTARQCQMFRSIEMIKTKKGFTAHFVNKWMIHSCRPFEPVNCKFHCRFNCFLLLLFLKYLPPYTLAGFDFMTHFSASRDDTNKRQRPVFKLFLHLQHLADVRAQLSSHLGAKLAPSFSLKICTQGNSTLYCFQSFSVRLEAALFQTKQYLTSPLQGLGAKSWT
jgi:hypothetical protein